MIFSKMWAAFRAQLNKIANIFFEADPIAQLQYEYDKATEELKTGRQGLEQYAGLVAQVNRNYANAQAHVKQLEAQTKAYLQAGDRDTAAKFALEYQKAKDNLAQVEKDHNDYEEAYQNNLKKIQHASQKLGELQQKIQKYDADLKMSSAEAEIAKVSESLDINVTTDFGQIENVIQRKIDQNRGKARVAMDMSSKGLDAIKAEENMQKSLAEDALKGFEVELGLRSPETTPVAESAKNLGPAVQTVSETPVKDLGPAEQIQQS